MNKAKEMLKVHPKIVSDDVDALAESIRECYNCAQICLACADACLNEKDIGELIHCIRTTIDCAEVCEATGKLLSRQTEFDWTLVRSQVEAALMTCQVCADKCQKLADRYKYCRLTQEACERCEETCNKWLQARSLAMR